MIEINFLPDIYSFFYFFRFFQKKITAGQKTTQKFPDLHSQILLNKYHFFQFSTHHRHTTWCGKFWKLNIFAPFWLCKSGNKFFYETQIYYIWSFTQYHCFNASKWPQMLQKWRRTIPFGSGHTLGTLNHGLGSLFCCFITLFGVRGSQDPPGAPWCPLAPPWTPWCPHDPWYVILGHSQSSWAIISHIWPIWSE